MKLRSLIVYDIDYKPLMKGLDIFFPKSTDNFIHANCFIGINGSGKSQVLELIAEIFLFLDRAFRFENKPKNVSSPFAFKIEYELILEKSEYLVIIECSKIKTKEKDISVEVLKRNDDLFIFNHEDVYSFLPNKVIGYTSGGNETLSLPFDTYYDEYAYHTGVRAKEKKEKGSTNKDDYDPKLYFMNYNTNLGIAISSLIFFDEMPNIEDIVEQLNISKLISFQITIQTKGNEAPSGEVILTDELENWLDRLIKCASKVEFQEKQKRYLLQYELDEITKIAFKKHFTSAFELYTCLYKFELLNNLIVKKEIRTKIEKERKERKLVTKMPMVADIDKVLSYSELKLELKNGNIVDYLSLSDGEHQFLNIFGTILMIPQDNCLFLLDEPETHFNPKWRRTFISTLKSITKDRNQDMIITSHSPFVVSDSKLAKVFIFKREENEIKICQPPKETYGASFDEILDMAFDIKTPISEDSLKEMEKFENETDVDILRTGIANFGDSAKKLSLQSRIFMLDSNKQK